MPWIVIACALLVGACRFSADYGGGHFTCTDDRCPSGLVCSAGVCVSGDSGVVGGDDAHDAPPIDARPAALTCTDPGLLAGAPVTGSTVARINTVGATCNSLVMNGPDAVYRIDATAGQMLTLTIDGAGTYPARAYVVAPCVLQPATPPCIGNRFATEASPVSITAASTGHQWIVVDGENAGLSGGYTLTVTVN